MSNEVARNISRYETSKRPLKKRDGSFLRNHSAVAEHDSSSSMDAATEEDRRLTLLHAATALASLPLAPGPSSFKTNKTKTSTTTTVHKTMEAAVALLDAEGAVAATKKSSKTFPEILMDVLSSPESRGMIEWLPDGKAFVILEPFDLATDILPRFFKQSQFESFVRKLNRWGFRRIHAKGGSSSTDHGSFYHDLFIRDLPELCRNMSCKARNGCSSMGNGPNRSHKSQFSAARGKVATSKRSPQHRVAPLVATGPDTVAVPSMCAAPSSMAGAFHPVNASKLRGSGQHKLALLPTLSFNHQGRSALPSSADSGSRSVSAEVSATRQLGQSAIVSHVCGPSTAHDFASLSSLLAKRNTAPATLVTAREQAVAPLSGQSFMKEQLTAPEEKVAASFLRHQRLLRMTQRSRAMLRQSGLFYGPPSM